MKNHSEPLEIESRVEVDIGNFVLRTRGLKQYKPFEMELRISQNLTGAPYERMEEVMQIAAKDLISHDLPNMTVLTIGTYGKLQIELAMNKEQQEVIYLQDIDSETHNADQFACRLMALTGFEAMEASAFSEAVEFFSAGLLFNPVDPILYQSRASATQDLLMSSTTNNNELASNYSVRIFDDLIQSIKLDPNRASAYRDLLVVLQSFKPVNGMTAEHKKWVGQVIEIALSHPTSNTEAIEARDALQQYCTEI